MSDKILRHRFYMPLIVGACLFVSAVAVYSLNFSGGLSHEQSRWGEFGDFVGGVVNPLIGLITIWLLVGTLAQQQRAVDAARESLREQQRAVEAAHESLRIQKESLEVQRQELADTRAELASSAAALANQVIQFDRKNEKDDLVSRADKVLIEVNDLVSSGNDLTMFAYQTPGAPHPKAVSTPVRKALTLMLQMPDDGVIVQPFDDAGRRFYTRLAKLLAELNSYLLRIDELSGGSMFATNYFRRRVSPWASALEIAQILDADTALQLIVVQPRSSRVTGTAGHAHNPR